MYFLNRISGVVETSPTNITMVSSGLAAGGAERVTSILANRWSQSGAQINIVTFSDPEVQPFYTLEPSVTLTQLGVASESSGLLSGGLNNIRRILHLRRAIARLRPDVVISALTETNIVTLIAMLGAGVPVIVAEHTDPESCPISKVWAWLRRRTYPWAARLVVLNAYVQSYFRERMGLQATIIANPIRRPETARENDEREAKQIVAVGRFATEKRFDILLRSFAKIAHRHPNWSMTIVGDGPLLSDIKDLSRSLSLDNRVSFPGIVPNTFPILRASDIFVSTSTLEGFPMALCEAMADGLAVVCAEYNAGVREIVHDNVNGVLVPPGNVEAVTRALERLIDNREERERIGKNAQRIVDKYGVDRVMENWNTLIEQVRH